MNSGGDWWHRFIHVNAIRYLTHIYVCVWDASKNLNFLQRYEFQLSVLEPRPTTSSIETSLEEIHAAFLHVLYNNCFSRPQDCGVEEVLHPSSEDIRAKTWCPASTQPFLNSRLFFKIYPLGESVPEIPPTLARICSAISYLWCWWWWCMTHTTHISSACQPHIVPDAFPHVCASGFDKRGQFRHIFTCENCSKKKSENKALLGNLRALHLIASFIDVISWQFACHEHKGASHFFLSQSIKCIAWKDKNCCFIISHERMQEDKKRP